MQIQKMSLANIQGKLTRAEMKNIMAGSGPGGESCNSSAFCRAGGDYCYSCSNTNGFGVCYYDTMRCHFA